MDGERSTLEADARTSKTRKSRRVREIDEEARLGFWLGVAGDLLLFAFAFVFWPGILSTGFFSPLDNSLLDGYGLAFVVLFCFYLGFVVEAVPACLASRYYVKKIYWPNRRYHLGLDGKPSRLSYVLRNMVFGLLAFLPLWTIIGGWYLASLVSEVPTASNLHPLDFVGELAMWLASLKGFNGPFYSGIMVPRMLCWLGAMSLFCFSVVQYYWWRVLAKGKLEIKTKEPAQTNMR